jgi:hypothetical protein
MEHKFGIALVRTDRIGHKIETQTTVMQFGFSTQIEASQVIDKSRKHLDQVHESLYTFEYAPEFSEGLEIGNPLPEFATLNSPVSF